MHRKSLLFAVLLLGVVEGLAQSHPTKSDLLDADRRFAQESQKEKLDAWVRWFANSVVLGGTPEPVKGEQQIREYYSGIFNDRLISLTWEPTAADLFRDEKTGYTVGRYTLRLRAENGSELTKTGTYLTVWKRQGDGSWKVISDFGAPDPAP